jgi:hypothetical protein
VYTKLRIQPKRKMEKIPTPETAFEVVWPDAVGYNMRVKAEFKERTPTKESQNTAFPQPSIRLKVPETLHGLPKRYRCVYKVARNGYSLSKVSWKIVKRRRSASRLPLLS